MQCNITKENAKTKISKVFSNTEPHGKVEELFPTADNNRPSTSKTSNVPEESDSNTLSLCMTYYSPKHIMPLRKAQYQNKMRKVNQNKGKTAVLTGSHYIKELQENRTTLKEKTNSPKKRLTFTKNDSKNRECCMIVIPC